MAGSKFRQNDLAAKWIPNGSAASSPPLSFGVSTSFGLDKVELRLFFFLFVCWLDRGVREGEGVGDR